jgi:hypothetical protein
MPIATAVIGLVLFVAGLVIGRIPYPALGGVALSADRQWRNC